MESWFVLNLGDAMFADAALERVCALFEQVGPTARASAILMRHESEGRLQCELKLYFPPELETMALLVGANPCAAPAAVGLGVLTGDPERLDRRRADCESDDPGVG